MANMTRALAAALRREVHGWHQFWWIFLRCVWRHRKRGNTAIPPLGLIYSWRAAQCAKYLVTGRHAPRYLRMLAAAPHPERTTE